MRYASLIELAKHLEPARILEIGVASGNTAMKLLANTSATYYGVDLFEDITRDIAVEEMNGKAVLPMDRVREKLEPWECRVNLFKGNTRDILPGLCRDWFRQGVLFDLAFIDGGHSEQTIASDFDAVEKVMSNRGVIVFDDYYTGPKVPEGFGCNRVVQTLIANGYEVSFTEPDVFNGLEIKLATVNYH